MFYQTVLQSVKNGVAVDVQGKRLTFIGYMQVQEGDTVWTDGSVIFGNVPPKGQPPPPIPMSGIPIAIIDENGDELKGKVVQIGTIRRYNIVTEDWFVNDDEFFQHGTDFIDNQKVIEAEIFKTQGGKELSVVTEGLYRKNQYVKYLRHLFVSYHYGVPFTYLGSEAYAVFTNVRAYQGEEVTLGVTSDSINQTAKVYKDNKLVEEIDLKPYADFISEKCWNVERQLMQLSQNNGANYTRQPAPPQSFIASNYARIVSFRIHQNGDWDAIIFATATGYCFPYALSDGSVLDATFNATAGATTTFSEALAACVENIELTIFSDNNFPFLQIEKYPTFKGVKKNGDKYTSEYKNYVENAIVYYIPRVRFKFAVWYPVNFGASCLLRVHNGEIISTMRLHAGGGNKVRSEYEWNETQKIYYVPHTFSVVSPPEENEWTFPITDNFYCAGVGNKIQSVCDETNNVVIDLENLKLNVGEYLEVSYPLDNYYDHEDSQKMILAERTGLDYRAFRESFVALPEPEYLIYDKDGTSWEKFWTFSSINTLIPQGGENKNKEIFSNYCPNLQNQEDYFFMDGFFDRKSDDGFFRFNPCLAKLTNTKYLFGVHGGEIFAEQNNSWVRGNKLKNFRLRELKNFSKAKK